MREGFFNKRQESIEREGSFVGAKGGHALTTKPKAWRRLHNRREFWRLFVLKKVNKVLKVQNSICVHFCRWWVFGVVVIVTNLPSCQDDDIFYDCLEISQFEINVLLCVWSFSTFLWFFSITNFYKFLTTFTNL